ncbi:hypothetical protein ACHAQD_007697 [Fusarium lateritium]
MLTLLSRKLQPSIQSYLKNAGTFNHKTTREEWEALYDDIATAEAKASESDNGPLEIFNKMVLKIGENSDSMAKAHSETRKAIFDAFTTVRDTVAAASSRGVHFQSHSSVYRIAGELYGSIVDAIQELLAIVESRKESRWRRTRKKAQLHDPKEILNTVKEKADALLTEVDNCRDAVIQKTGKDAQQTLGRVEFVCWKAVEIRESVSRVQQGQDKQLSILENVNQKQDVLLKLSQCREESNEGLLEMLRDQQKKDQATITKLEWIIRKQLLVGPDPYIPAICREGTSKAVVSLKQLFKILSSSTRAAADRTMDSDLGALQMRNNDLHIVMSSAAAFHPTSQSQAFSALNHDRFFDWMHLGHPDLIYIDGNCQVNPTDSTSPLSLLCARIGLTMAKMEPDNVFVHFYCGLHVDPGRNNWYGPDGMVRSVLVQLLTALVDKDILDMSFLNRRSFVRDLEDHDIHALCDMFHRLVQQFDAETTIYCFIDSVSKFDIDFRGTFTLLKVILERIQDIVEDDNLKPKLKVLMTVPFRSSQRLKKIIDEEFYMSLSPHVLGSRQLSEGSIESAIRNPQTPSSGFHFFY